MQRGPTSRRLGRHRRRLRRAAPRGPSERLPGPEAGLLPDLPLHQLLLTTHLLLAGFFLVQREAPLEIVGCRLVHPPSPPCPCSPISSTEGQPCPRVWRVKAWSGGGGEAGLHLLSAASLLAVSAERTSPPPRLRPARGVCGIVDPIYWSLGTAQKLRSLCNTFPSFLTVSTSVVSHNSVVDRNNGNYDRGQTLPALGLDNQSRSFFQLVISGTLIRSSLVGAVQGHARRRDPRTGGDYPPCACNRAPPEQLGVGSLSVSAAPDDQAQVTAGLLRPSL